ncbi:YonK family protein [Aquibacillus saliphilus]|uniref:YonK family protein n=1 Tax=Aquibacillus saliphilus TaxID=1909422 RepID=UPI001CF0D0C1|nr:YonK family protein [Aquibacillus saliphilus]
MGNPKSKIDRNLTLVGLLNLEEGLITETVKDVGDLEYRFLERLREFDGKEVTLTVREKQDISPSSM